MVSIQPQTRERRSPIAKWSFSMYNIHIYCILFEQLYAWSRSTVVHLKLRMGQVIRSLQILNIPNDWSANLLHSYLFWASCELGVMSYALKTLPKSLCVLMRTLLGFSRNNCVGMACIDRPHLDYWTHALLAARSVRRSSFIVFCINLVYLNDL